MDDIGIKLCTFQANIFEKSKEYFQCSSNFFIKIFMNSQLASRIDNKNFIFESTDEKSCFNELNIKKINKTTTDIYPSFVLSWIGYLYRYACYEFQISSKRIYSIIKPKELSMLYEAYHSLEVKDAIIRIFESKNISVDNINYSEKLAKEIYLSEN